MLKAFLKRYKRPLMWLAFAYALVILILIVLASGPQSEPFIYQMF